MKTVRLLIIALAIHGSVLAHDEGHGPKLTDTAKHGGLVAPVIAASESKLGSKATVVYKAELVRGDENKTRLYLYDAKMEPLKLDGFEKTAKAVLETLGKKSKRTDFELKLENDAFVGTAPKATKKPFNIDVHLKEGDRSLLVAFDNLD
jgi:hypothetical protein